jgi:hypothetical protein
MGQGDIKTASERAASVTQAVVHWIAIKILVLDYKSLAFAPIAREKARSNRSDKVWTRVCMIDPNRLRDEFSLIDSCVLNGGDYAY